MQTATSAAPMPSDFVAKVTDQHSINPLVTDEPYLRFYAGALILSGGGVPVGTLCVLDYTPRHGVTLEQGDILLALARLATILLIG